MRENAAYPRGRYHKFLPYPTEDRIFHKESHSKFSHAADNPHTSENQFFHNRHMREEKANQARSKLNDIVYMTSLSNLPLQKSGSE